MGQFSAENSRSPGQILVEINKLAPKFARRIAPDGSEKDVPLETVVVGDRLRVRPGEKIPVDGELLEGRSSVDEFHGHRRIDARYEDRPAPAQ